MPPKMNRSKIFFFISEHIFVYNKNRTNVLFCEVKIMNGLLLNAKKYGFALKMIYMTDQGVITERLITVKDFNDKYIRAYCHFRKTFRTFKRSNILSIGPIKKRKIG